MSLGVRLRRQSVDCTRLLHSEEQTCPRTSPAVVARTVVPHRAVVDPQAEAADVLPALVVTAAAAPVATDLREAAPAAVAPVVAPSAVEPAAATDVRVAPAAAVTAGPPGPGWPPGSRSSPNPVSPRA